MKHLEENYDTVVVGAGRAGCEAALAGRDFKMSNDHVYGKCRVLR